MSPQTKLCIDNSVQAAVYDSRLLIIIPDEKGKTINQFFQNDIQLWKELSYPTGAKIDLPLCYFTSEK